MFWLFLSLIMIRALSPEEKTVQFKGKIEKEVEFRLDQSHLLLFEERGHPFLRRRVRCSTLSGRFSRSGRRWTFLSFWFACSHPRPFCKEQIVLETTVTTLCLPGFLAVLGASCCFAETGARGTFKLQF